MAVLQVLLLASLLEPATLGESYTSTEILITDVVVNFPFLLFFPMHFENTLLEGVCIRRKPHLHNHDMTFLIQI